MLFNADVDCASTERLRRVRCFNKYPAPAPGDDDLPVQDEDPGLDLDEMIRLGDMVCGKVAHMLWGWCVVSVAWKYVQSS